MRVTERAHQSVRAVVRSGDHVVDATAGNGHDVAFLAELVGVSGKVHAFDLQQAALATTEEKLREAGLLDHCALHHLSHERMAEVMPPETRGRIHAIVFNLGYLPGGDKEVTTKADTTAAALRAALRLLRPGGLLAVIAYRGHPGGKDECEAARRELETEEVEFSVEGDLSSEATSPLLLVARKG